MDKLIDRPTGITIDSSIVKPTVRSSDIPVDISVYSSTNKLVERATDNSVDKPKDMLVDRLVVSSTEKLIDKPVDRSTVKTINVPIDRSVDRSVASSTNKSADMLVDRSTNNTIYKPTNGLIQLSIDKPIDNPADCLIDKPIDTSIDKPADNLVDRSIDKPIDETINKPIVKSIDIPIITPTSQLTSRRVSRFREITSNITENVIVNEITLDREVDSRIDGMIDNIVDSEIGRQLLSKSESKVAIQLDSQLDSNIVTEGVCQVVSKSENTIDSEIYNYISIKTVSQLDTKVDSQLAGMVVSNSDTEILNQVDNEIGSLIDSKIYHQLEKDCNINSRIYGKIVIDIASQLDSTSVNQFDYQLDGEVDNKLASKIGSYIENQFGNKLDNRIVLTTGNQIDCKINEMPVNNVDSNLDSQKDSNINIMIDIEINKQLDKKIESKINKEIDNKLDSNIVSKRSKQLDNTIKQLDNQIENELFNKIDKIDKQLDNKIVSKADKQLVNKINSKIASQSTNEQTRKPLSTYFPHFSALFTATHRSQSISAERLVGLMRFQCKMYEEWIQIMSDYSTVFSEQRGINAISSSDDSSKMYNGNSRALHYRVKSSKPEVSNIITDVLSNLSSYQPTNQTSYPPSCPSNYPTNYPTSDLTQQLTNELPNYPSSNRKNYLTTNQEWFELPNGFGLGLTWNLLWTWARPSIDSNQLLVWQKVNHFVDNKHLTHKDMLKKSISRYVDNHNSKISEFFDIMPATFILPYEYTTFLSAFLKYEQIKSSMIPWTDPTTCDLSNHLTQSVNLLVNQLTNQPSNELTYQPPNQLSNQLTRQSNDIQNLWIVKPIGMSRGRGISLISQIAELTYATASVIQKYIERPLLLDGYKFDLRLYVLVTSFQPVEAFLYRDGFARVSTEPYSTNPSNLTNKFIHLTNSSIQRYNNETSGLSDNDVSEGGSKISLLGESGLWSRLKQLYPQIDIATVWNDISLLIVKSLVIVNDKIPNQPNSFEIFGYDVIIQDDFTPRLLEVNSSPSLARPHRLDQLVKDRMIYDTIRLLDIPMYDRKVLVDVFKRRLNEIVKMKVNWMNRHESSLDDDLNEILGSDYVPRLYGEVPNYIGNFEMLCPNTKLYDLVIRYKSKIIKSLKDS